MLKKEQKNHGSFIYFDIIFTFSSFLPKIKLTGLNTNTFSMNFSLNPFHPGPPTSPGSPHNNYTES